MVDAVSPAATQGVLSTQMSFVQNDKPTAAAAPAPPPPQPDSQPTPSGGRGQAVDVTV